MIKHTIWKSKPDENQYRNSPYWERPRKPRTQEVLDDWLKKYPFKLDQLVVYDYQGNQLTKDIYPISVVLVIEGSIDRVVWESHQDNPQPFKMMGLSHWSPGLDINKDNRVPYLRWTDGRHMRPLLPDEEHLVDDNLQNYLKDATAKYRNHWCFRG